MASVSSASNDRYRQKWYRRRPLLLTAVFTDLQYGSYVASVYSMLQSILMIVLTIFDIYCLHEAAPGSVHFRSYGFSFLFVYSGNRHVRNLLFFTSAVSFVLAVYLLVTSIILMIGLRKEYEAKFRPWLTAIMIFTVWRMLAILYRSIANDLYYGYHQAMLVIWILLIVLNIYMWLVVLSNYQELSDMTRLEDMAKLKVGTMSSLNQSHSVDSVRRHSFSRHSDESTSKMSNTRSTTPRSGVFVDTV